MDNGEMPDSNHDVGLPGGHEFKKRAVDRVDVGYDGVITITYNEQSGVDGGTIKLRPDDGPLGINWECETRSFKAIKTWMPLCRYLG